MLVFVFSNTTSVRETIQRPCIQQLINWRIPDQILEWSNVHVGL